jgi:hypothetical protein
VFDFSDTQFNFASSKKVPRTQVVSEAARIRALSVGDKVKLAYLGNQEARRVLIRDTNRLVASSVIRSGRLTPNEVVQYARNRNVSKTVVNEIARSRTMVRAYPVKVALVNNPKTALPVAMRLVPHLHRRDLKALSRSREVPATISRTAREIHKKRYLNA